MDEFEIEIKKDYLNEAYLNLEEVEVSFMELETSSDPAPLLDKIFRMAHNLKGVSAAVGFNQVAELTHQLESLVLKIQKGQIALSSALISTLLATNDKLVEMHKAYQLNVAAVFDNTDIMEQLNSWLTGKKTEVTNETSTPDVQPETESPVAPERPAAKSSGAPVKDEDEVVRVNMSKINLLNDFVGELIVLQSVVEQQNSSVSGVQQQALFRQMIKISKEIQSLSMGLRMIPVKPLVQKLQRVVRDASKALGKDVILEVQGEHLEIDKSVLDKLADPLIHILRNGVDHGLEDPIDRIGAGKDIRGKLKLSFINQGNNLVVEVKDDGNGINLRKVKEIAIQKDLITAEQELTEKENIALIFHPGFSTKTEVSSLSGRGVGMDVVKTNVENVGGTIDVTTQQGQGSVFKIQIPLSLAVIEGLVVQNRENRYVIPLTQVQESVSLRFQKVHTDKLGIGSCLELRGTVVPLISIEEALKNGKKEFKPDGTAMIIHVDGKPLGLVVDDILRSQQIVIKPLNNGVGTQNGWIGSCVLGDGLPTLVLNPVELLKGKIANGLGEINITEVA